MKLDLSVLSLDQFMVHQHYVGEHEVFLAQPVHIGTEWAKDNLHFRSVVVNKDGEVISASFKKFFNWGEKPHITQPPTSLANAKLMEKLDGSTLIFSRYKGHSIIRTRGTVDARKQDNGYEVDYLLEKYSKFKEVFENDHTSDKSYVFEWLSPTNRIVLDYGTEPDMVLVAVIFHEDYTMMTQDGLDVLAAQMHLRRPRTYSYNSVEDMKQAVNDMKGMEGICVYFHGDQEILKVKSAQYLFLHRAKSEVSSIEKVMDVYLDLHFTTNGGLDANFPSYQQFFDYMEKVFDHEIATIAQGHISRIADGMKEVVQILDGMKRFIEPARSQTRKDAAEKILQAYGSTGRSAMLFKMLDGKKLVADDYKKLLFQVLK